MARDPHDYPRLCDQATAERVAAHFADLRPSRVERYEVPQLFALKFVLFDVLAGGVTCALNLDAHGKCLSSCLLDMELSDV